MADPPFNPILAKSTTECDHEIRAKITKDGVELWHYGDPLLRDAPLVPKEGQTDTGLAVVLIRRWHKLDEEERKRREKLHG